MAAPTPQSAENELSNLAVTLRQTLDTNIVLVDNNTAFATDGTTVVSFNVSTLQQNWVYTSTGGTLSFVAATSGGGASINDSQQGVVQLDSSGNASAASSAVQGSIPYDMVVPAYTSLPSNLGLWATATTSGLGFILGPPDPLASSLFAEPTGAGQKQRSAVPIPVSIQYVQGDPTYLNESPFTCANQIALPRGFDGYAYCAKATILDINKHAIKNQPLLAWETVQLATENPPDLGITIESTHDIGIPTGNNGTFYDSLTFADLNNPGFPPSGYYYKTKQFITITNKLKSYNNLIILCHDFQWNKSILTDVTAAPNASCQDY